MTDGRPRAAEKKVFLLPTRSENQIPDQEFFCDVKAVELTPMTLVKGESSPQDPRSRALAPP